MKPISDWSDDELQDLVDYPNIGDWTSVRAEKAEAELDDANGAILEWHKTAKALTERIQVAEAERDSWKKRASECYRAVGEAEDELARMRPVVEAALELHFDLLDTLGPEDPFVVAVDAYRNEESR